MKKSITLIGLFLCFLSLQAQVDTVPPVLVCTAEDSYTLLVSGGMLTIWADDYIESVTDDQSQNIEIGMRKSCTGTGFPEHQNALLFAWETVGRLEIWARDEAGNTSVCYLEFDLFFIVTEQGMTEFQTLTVAHDTVAAQPIWNVDYTAIATNCFSDTVTLQLPPYSHTENFYYAGFGLPTEGYDIRLEAAKNTHPLNGVTTLDLVLITKHILGLEPLDSPYKIIAADANQDGLVTIFDVVVLRKLILGITTELPNGKSWRFIDKNHVFPDPTNPFLWSFPEFATLPASGDGHALYFGNGGWSFLKGIKIGDVNFSADPTQ